MVTNVTRDGRVSGYQTHRCATVTRGTPPACMIISVARLRGHNAWTVLDGLPREWPGQSPDPKRFHCVSAARAALLAELDRLDQVRAAA
jgi:hypothetical protein